MGPGLGRGGQGRQDHPRRHRKPRGLGQLGQPSAARLEDLKWWAEASLGDALEKCVCAVGHNRIQFGYNLFPYKVHLVRGSWGEPKPCAPYPGLEVPQTTVAGRGC